MLRGGHEPSARIVRDARLRPALERDDERVLRQVLGQTDVAGDPGEPGDERSEEHTSELQSQSNLVCRLLLEKKKKLTAWATASALPSDSGYTWPSCSIIRRIDP